MKRRLKIVHTTLSLIALGAFRLTPAAVAVLPPPDGGYSGGNTAEGQSALLSLTTGTYNIALGLFSLVSLAEGNFNTGVGAATLLANTADRNTATGAGALLSNTIGEDNTANGAFALLSNTEGISNTAVGGGALFSNISGSQNTAVGVDTLHDNIASGNTAVGCRALLNNTTGGTLGDIQGIDVGPNVAVGEQALESNTVASANTAVGYQALHSFMTGPTGFEQLGLCTAVGFQALANSTAVGFGNSAFGYQALKNNTDGSGNTAIGLRSLFGNTTGRGNVANGNSALYTNATGGHNTAMGESALQNHTDGDDNTAIGWFALYNNITGDGNIALGAFSGNGVTTANNVICIGASVGGGNVNNSCYIGNIWNQPGGSQAVYVNSDGKLGALLSSRRFKNEIKPMGDASEAIYGLQPVSFRYKTEIEPTRTLGFGLIAEEVEKINPDLVTRDNDGKVNSVRYDAVNAMLLNEFLKEHKKLEKQAREIQEQRATISELKKAMETAVARLREQDSKIQRVSDQVEISKLATRRIGRDEPRPRVVVNE